MNDAERLKSTALEKDNRFLIIKNIIYTHMKMYNSDKPSNILKSVSR